MATKGSFYSDTQPINTETSPASPASTPLTDPDKDTKSSFYGSGSQYASVETVQSTYSDMVAAQDAAQQSADEAAASATASANSAAASANSATASANSAAASSTSAQSAGDSASAAATSEANAAASDASASTQATDAANSAASAAASNTAAGTSETNAANSATAAATSATNAANSASAAQTSANDAAASAASATTTADNEIAAKAVRFDAAQVLTAPQQAQARTNIALGDAATHAASDFATATQGAKADTAVQPASLATVATTGAYSDLTGKPTLGTAAALNVGTADGDVVQVQTGSKLPALDGSLLTGIAATGGSGSAGYQTRADLAAATPDASQSAVLVMRYSTSTPLAPAVYLRLASAPGTTELWHVQDASGAWWQLAQSDVSPEMLGAIRDGVTDDITAVQGAVNFALTLAASVRLTGFYGISLPVTIADGIDPGALVIEGVGFDVCGFNMLADTAGIYAPATGTNRHTGFYFSKFKIDGANTPSRGIFITNALDCVFDHLHIIRFGGHTFYFDHTTGYGHLRITIKDCKTSGVTNAAKLQVATAAVRLTSGNYATIQNNYFSGFTDGTAWMQSGIFTEGDSTLSEGNIFESFLECMRFSGSSCSSINDKPVGSTIQNTSWFVITGNFDTYIAYPRGTAWANIDVSAVTAGNGYPQVFIERVGWVSGT